MVMGIARSPALVARAISASSNTLQQEKCKARRFILSMNSTASGAKPRTIIRRRWIHTGQTASLDLLIEKKDTSAALTALDSYVEKGVAPPATSACKLVELLCERKQIDDAYAVLNQIYSRGNVSGEGWIALASIAVMDSFLQRGDLAKAMELYRQTRWMDIVLDLPAYKDLLSRLAGAGRFAEAIEVLEEMRTTGPIRPDHAAYNGLILSLIKEGKLCSAFHSVRHMRCDGLIPHTTVLQRLNSALVHRYESTEQGDEIDDGFSPDSTIGMINDVTDMMAENLTPEHTDMLNAFSKVWEMAQKLEEQGVIKKGVLQSIMKIIEELNLGDLNSSLEPVIEVQVIDDDEDDDDDDDDDSDDSI